MHNVWSNALIGSKFAQNLQERQGTETINLGKVDTHHALQRLRLIEANPSS
jgi:hypothetical protein